jgi:predicted chitinase
MALAAVAQGALRVGALLGKSAMGVTKAAGSAAKSGISSGAKNVNKQVKKAVLKRKKIKRDTFIGKQRSKKKEQEKDKRKLKEQELERKNTSKSGPGVGNVAKKALNPLQALIQFLTTILIGWVANKLPQIIEWAQGLIKKIQEVVELIKSLFTNITGFFTGVKDLIVGAFDAVVNLDFSDKEGGITSALEKIKESFGGLIKDIGNGFNILRGKQNEDPKKILKKQPEDVTNEQPYSELKPPKSEDSVSSSSSSSGSNPVSTPLTPIVTSKKSTPGGQYGESSLLAAMSRAGIVDPTERAMFLAQMAHESGNFRYDEEIASGQAYEGRSDLGNTQPGDGVRYKGRGYIQLTGRANYRDYGNRLGVDLENNPDLAKDPNIAADIAIAYWQQRVDRNAARAGDVRTVTRNINGGLNGLADRQNKFDKYMKEKGTLSIKKFDPTKSYKAGDMVIKNDKVMRHDGFGFAEAGGVSSQNLTASPQPQIQSAPRMAQLDMDRQGQDIVVVDDQPTPQQPSGVPGQQSSPQPIIVQPSLNSMLRQQLLLELVYT